MRGVLVFLVGCGISPPATPPIELTVRDGANFAYFIRADDSFEMVELDANGHASVAADHATVVVEYDDRVVSFAGIAAGAQLVVGAPPAPARTQHPRVTVPRYGAYEDYAVLTSCGGTGAVHDASGSPLVTIPVDAAPCDRFADATVVATAGDGYASLGHVDLAQPIQLPTLQTQAEVDIVFENLGFTPAPGSYTTADVALLDRGDVVAQTTMNDYAFTPSGDGGTFHAPMPPVGDATQFSARVFGFQGEVAYQHALAGRGPFTVDANAAPHATGAWDGRTLTWSDDATAPEMVLATSLESPRFYAYGPGDGTFELPAYPFDGGPKLAPSFAVMTLSTSYAEVLASGFATPPFAWKVPL